MVAEAVFAGAVVVGAGVTEAEMPSGEGVMDGELVGAGAGCRGGRGGRER